MTRSLGIAVIGAGMAGKAHAAAYRTAPTLFNENVSVVEVWWRVRALSLSGLFEQLSLLAAKIVI
jgi:hypothetical protein